MLWQAKHTKTAERGERRMTAGLSVFGMFAGQSSISPVCYQPNIKLDSTGAASEEMART